MSPLRLLATVLVLGAAAPAPAWAGSGPALTKAQADALFSAPASPVNVRATTGGGAVAKLVTGAGATLKASDAHGDLFVLAIPKGAVLDPVRITMTPVAKIDGMPSGISLVGAVQLEPGGLVFYRPATLTITPAHPVPDARRIPLAYRGNGDDLHLAIPGKDPKAIQIAVFHFTGFGLGSGLGTSREKLLLSRAADHEARLQQEAAALTLAAQAREKAGTCDDACRGDLLASLDRLQQSYDGLVLRPRLLAAGSSCESAGKALDTVVEASRIGQFLLGKGQGAYSKELTQALEAQAAACEREAVERCQSSHDPRELLDVLLRVAHRDAALGLPVPQTVVRDALNAAYTRCKAAFEVRQPLGDVGVLQGTICDMTKPFTLEASGGTGTFTFTFSPASAVGGTYTDHAVVKGGPAFETGGGTYEVDIVPEGTGAGTKLWLSIVVHDKGTLTQPLGRQSYTAQAHFHLIGKPHGC